MCRRRKQCDGHISGLLDEDIELIGAEAAGKGIDTPVACGNDRKGTLGVIHGSMTYLIQDEYGQIIEPYSISAGLDYPGSALSTPICIKAAV